ncbi:MAG TPA: hypothetical protein VM099_05995 [Gemmatimonadaceae bacterium]|nr:hypothetical protein [Gemmatimonadaceae bacterium]
MIALLMIIAPACTKIVDPMLDPRAVELSLPAVYARWWSMVENCSGLTGSMEAVSWYQVPNSSTVVDNDGEVSGYWSPASNRIVLAGNLILIGSIVRHEMLHAIVRQTNGHSREYFLGRCAGVVVCGAACLADAGPPPQPDINVARINSSGLTLTVSTVPQFPKSTVDGGVFTVIVTATNPRPFPVVVQLTQNSGHTFGYSLTGALGNAGFAGISDIGVAYFAAGETKTQYFDFSIGSPSSQRVVAPAIYRIFGVYDATSVSVANVTIGP